MNPGELGEREDLDAEVRAFARLQDVLAGRLRVPLDGSSSMMFRIMVEGPASDALVTPDVVAVHVGPRRRRRPLRYSCRLVTAVASELLDRSSVRSLSSPLIVGLPAGDVARIDSFPSWSYDAKLVWIAPADAAVKIVVRTSPERWRAPFSQPVPSDGPLALGELPPWEPRVEHLELENALACPTCSVESSRYRQLREALVCDRCGRSFDYRS
ncbi:MAG: hypothetical protein BGO98_45020 [Myxococcales bacterium 68-20]|nr:MAG: hypothetical protein BGO98_45020 [Myxococcales bacterium 68-20]